MALQQMEKGIKELLQETQQPAQDAGHAPFLDDTIDLGNQSKMIDASFSQFCAEFVTNVDDRQK